MRSRSAPLPLRRIATALLFALLLALRLPHLNDSPYGYDSWRQSDTESMARHFVERLADIRYPQLNYQGPPPNYAQLELQLTTWLISLLYRLFGYHYALARIVPVLFFIGSAWFVYRIALRYFTLGTAWLAVLLYGIVPLNVLYSRAIMPESAALFFYVGAFYWFSEATDRKSYGRLALAAAFTALAICEKVPTVFVGIPMLVMAFAAYRLRAFFRLELWAFAVAALVPPFVYYRWLGTIAESDFVSGIATKHVLPDMATAWLTAQAAAFFVRELPKAFTPAGLLLFAFGLAALRWRRHYALGSWALAMLAELATIVAVIRFNYYLIFLSPLVALLGADALARAAALVRRIGPGGAGGAAAFAVVALAVGFVVRDSFAATKPLLGLQHGDLLRQAAVAERLTAPDDLIAVGTDDPSLLNATHRAGWRVTNSIPDDPVAELDYFVREGAAYFVPLKGYIDGDPEGRLRRYLDARFPKIVPADPAEADYFIYDLRRTLPGSALPST
ncbi:ArnT family glycosyltransferase [Paenibacillus flagellatus]|uniref:Dolichyl-phosphate-mannose--protein mannosyltransferase n=1 Tax=Paenibacillus flagellatus TaxID=2211139 RepID=A0A2V5K580_9BACL|nr:glycosyltransferase family 39 protein [Paenibacillus flagellatus]PYI53094.1 dolichyl-phosphate-mannose--protein mannosyltransferase [Paenibacillus flagellatus]